MKRTINRKIETWSIAKIEKLRQVLVFPEYQRQPKLWTIEKKSLLIDSILNDLDIPKLYFNKTPEGLYEVVDGQQRLWAIWDFLDETYDYQLDGQSISFSELKKEEKVAVREYELQVTVFDDAEDDYLRKLFVRLQLGLFLVTGEKLHAAKGEMQRFVFEAFPKSAFIAKLGIPKRRYAMETLGAQIAINSFTRARTDSFARTRYEDLSDFFVSYANPKGADLKFFHAQCAQIVRHLHELHKIFGDKAAQLKNRSYVLSVFLLYEDLKGDRELGKDEEKKLSDFVLHLWRRMKEEGKAGIDRKNRELFSFENMMSSAPGEKYQIERRHLKLIEFFEYFLEKGQIKGD